MYTTRKASVLVAVALVVIGHHVQTPGVEHFVQPLHRSLALWSRNLGPHDWARRLVWEQGRRAGVGSNRAGSGRGIVSLESDRCSARGRKGSRAGERRPSAACSAQEGGHR